MKTRWLIPEMHGKFLSWFDFPQQAKPPKKVEGQALEEALGADLPDPAEPPAPTCEQGHGDYLLHGPNACHQCEHDYHAYRAWKAAIAAAQEALHPEETPPASQ
jgi:hypothetical protein